MIVYFIEPILAFSTSIYTSLMLMWNENETFILTGINNKCEIEGQKHLYIVTIDPTLSLSPPKYPIFSWIHCRAKTWSRKPYHKMNSEDLIIIYSYLNTYLIFKWIKCMDGFFAWDVAFHCLEIELRQNEFRIFNLFNLTYPPTTFWKMS